MSRRKRVGKFFFVALAAALSISLIQPILREDKAFAQMCGYKPTGSFCSTPQYPTFGCGGPSTSPVPQQYLPAGCAPGFSFGCVPFVNTFTPLFFGPSLINETINCFEIPTNLNPDGTTGTGQSSKDRVESLLPHLQNDREIPDTSRSTKVDLSKVTSDVFKTQPPAATQGDGCKNAAQLCKDGKFQEALNAVDREDGAKDSMCHYVRANANLGLGHWDEALKDVRECQKSLPNFAPAFFTEGSILCELNKLSEAVEAYSKALSLKPNSVRYLDGRAAVFYRAGQFINAIKDYERVLEINAKDPNALYMRGLCYYMIGQYQMVPVAYNDYLAVNPGDVAALTNRGSAYLELGKYDAALADFDAVLALEPKHVTCLYKRCLLQWHLGRWRAAYSDADTALSAVGFNDSNSAYLALCKYLLALKAGDQTAAAEVLNSSLKSLDSKKWPYPLFQFFAGNFSESDLLLMATTKEQWTQARTYIAIKTMWTAGTDKQRGLVFLNQVRSEGTSSVPEYNLALGELYRDKVKDVTNVTRPVANRYALVIGVSKFRDTTINLRYSDKDAQDFGSFLVNSEGFKKDNVKLLLNEEATRENILSALGESWLPRKANKDDLVLIYFSTHGSPSKMDAKGLNYLLAHDTDKDVLYATGIPVQDLTRMVKDKVHADRVIVIMDACHSGAAKTDDHLPIDASDLSNQSGQAVICSSLPEEVSWESKQYPNSVFTHHLMDGLKSKGSSTSIGDSFAYARDHVEQEVWNDRKHRQTPIMKTTWSKSDLAISSGQK